MKFHLILGLFVAPFAAVVGQFSAPLGLIGWVIFLSWAGFFASGGQVMGLVKTGIGVMAGLLGGYAVIEFAAMSAFSNPILLPLGGVIFVFCFLGQFRLFFVPAAFLGCAAYMGAGALFWETFLSLILGTALGFFTEQLTQKFAGKA